MLNETITSSLGGDVELGVGEKDLLRKYQLAEPCQIFLVGFQLIYTDIHHRYVFFSDSSLVNALKILSTLESEDIVCLITNRFICQECFTVN